MNFQRRSQAEADIRFVVLVLFCVFDREEGLILIMYMGRYAVLFVWAFTGVGVWISGNSLVCHLSGPFLPSFCLRQGFSLTWNFTK